ncbi:MAG TPA: DUF2971 domain-containing protein [Patescibacteria group bacterium]|nr:DUF2971 domain-containing protein [Patescibacteria group bacterium]
MANIVYHYTSPEGVYSILTDKALWFTDCQYLNDKNEFLYIREPFTEAYKKVCIERGDPLENIDNFVNSMCLSPYEGYDWSRFFGAGKQKWRGFPPKYRYYILCASCDYDTVNMWNYYVKNGLFCGYNLGLDTAVICEWFSQCDNDQVSLENGEIIYNREQQVEILYNKLIDSLSIYDRRIAQSPEGIDSFIDEFQDDLSDFINQKKLFFKHPAFECEKEYRYILKVHNDFREEENLETKFRVGSSGIITPYIEWKFDDLKPLLFKQITLSPMIEEELAKESFKRFLRNDVFQNISIVPSSIKLRY